jgi:PAS domain S-box-containing protein
MTNRSTSVFAASAGGFRFYHFVAAGVAVLLAAGAVGALGVAGGLAQATAAAPTLWWLPPATLLEPFLLLLLGTVATACALCLWTVTHYERRLALYAESRARNRAIVDNMLDGAIHVDAAGRVAGMNAAAERIFGFRAAELKGQPFPLLFPPPLRERLEAEMQAHPDVGLPAALVGRHRAPGRRRDGTQVDLSLSVTEVHVGGWLVYTAVVRELHGAPEPLPEIRIRAAAQAH